MHIYIKFERKLLSLINLSVFAIQMLYSCVGAREISNKNDWIVTIFTANRNVQGNQAA